MTKQAESVTTKNKEVLTAAQEALCREFTVHASAELNGAEALYQAIVKAARVRTKTKQVDADGIALAVKHAYLRSGASEASARVRASEAKKVVLAIRDKAPGFNASDYKRLQAAAKAAPAVTKRGTKKRAATKPAAPAKSATKTAPEASNPVEHLATIERALNGLRKSVGDNVPVLELVAELSDMAATLASLLMDETKSA